MEPIIRGLLFLSHTLLLEKHFNNKFITSTPFFSRLSPLNLKDWTFVMSLLLEKANDVVGIMMFVQNLIQGIVTAPYSIDDKFELVTFEWVVLSGKEDGEPS